MLNVVSSYPGAFIIGVSLGVAALAVRKGYAERPELPRISDHIQTRTPDSSALTLPPNKFPAPPHGVGKVYGEPNTLTSSVTDRAVSDSTHLAVSTERESVATNNEVAPENIAGRYGLSDQTRGNTLTIHQNDDGTITFRLDAVRFLSQESLHTGTLTATVPLINHEAEYVERQFGGECPIHLTFEDTSAVITGGRPERACGFGALVSVDGRYSRAIESSDDSSAGF